ncbi:Conserved_hypothetical protein [Hexamita inflata]|uniref:Uncharacterized protein n=1 Tax=Hexamita inflata TaxID=28002 RepID=A0AA86NCU3_9EUKA|nr:Conserved hypothetical protein [Hexamita inflata]
MPSGKNYEQERHIQKVTENKDLPSVRTVQRFNNQQLEEVDYYNAHIGFNFDIEKLLPGITAWKQSNKIAYDQIIKAVIQLDAVYVNRQVYIDEFGKQHNTIIGKDGKERAISYIFTFLLVTECEAESLPIFCQLSSTGSCSQKQLDTYFQICDCLLKYNIDCSFSLMTLIHFIIVLKSIHLKLQLIILKMVYLIPTN